MKVIVTGGAGFIGSHLCEHFASKENEVIAIDNFARTQILTIPAKIKDLASYNRSFLQRLPNVRLVEEDVRHLNVMEELFKDADVVFHTAGQVAVTTSIQDPILDFQINALGTLSVCEAARKSADRAPIIFCSTNKVYGAIDSSIEQLATRYAYKELVGIDERHPLDANCPYGSSKISAETILKSYFDTYGLPTIRPRLSCIYGARQLGCEDQAWVAHFVLSVLINEPITIYGDGKQVRDILFVSDLVNGFKLLAENSKKTSGQAFNIGGGIENSISLLEMVDCLQELTGKSTSVKFSRWRKGDQRIYISDTSKINKMLGWKPMISVKEGLRKMVQWYKVNTPCQ